LVPIRERESATPEEQAYNCAVCNPLLFRDGLRVNVHGALHSRVPQQFLLHLDVGSKPRDRVE
jgi:hypothetical protein